jgi:type IV pilus assembly protein PilN
VILINLLPHREAKRQQRKRAFFTALGLAALAGVGIVAVWYTILGQLTTEQQARNQFLSSEIARLESQIKDIATLKAEIDALKARQKAVEDLQSDRNLPVYLLDELVKQTPEGVYLTAIRQAGDVVAVTGISQTNERVSEFLRNTAYNSPWMERPELIEIKASNANNSRDPRRVFEFSMRVTLKRPQSPGVAASGASVTPPLPAPVPKPTS